MPYFFNLLLKIRDTVYVSNGLEMHIKVLIYRKVLLVCEGRVCLLGPEWIACLPLTWLASEQIYILVYNNNLQKNLIWDPKIEISDLSFLIIWRLEDLACSFREVCQAHS